MSAATTPLQHAVVTTLEATIESEEARGLLDWTIPENATID
jgi:hypothetical protein